MRLAGVALAIGVGVLVYRGPGRPFIRGHVGDVAATMLVYALIGLAMRARPMVRACATMAIATAVELGQLVWSGTGTAGELTIGTTFDYWDFAAYITGTIVAVVWDVVSYHRAHGESRSPVASV